MRKIQTAILMLLLAGCADSTRLMKQDHNTLSKTSSFYVSIPEDGIYGIKPYTGSGKMTSLIIKSSLSENSRKVAIGRKTETLEAALHSTRTGGYDYLVIPTILHWEDRATEWNFMRDKVKVKIEFVDAFSGNVESSAIVEGKSGIATLGGDHPQDLLPEPISEYLTKTLK